MSDLPTIDSEMAILAEIDFQIKVRSTSPLPPGLEEALLTLPFPDSAPPSLRYAPNYDGLKVFEFEDRWFCFSRFFFRESKDEYGRAVPSSYCLVLDKNALKGNRLTLHKIYEYLSEFLMNLVPHETLIHDLQGLLEVGVSLQEEAGLRSFVSLLNAPPALLFQSLAQTLLSKGQIFCTEDMEEGLGLMSAVFALLPADLKGKFSYCTFVDSDQGAHEDVIIYPCAPVEQKSSWFSKLIGGGKGGDPTRTDLKDGGADNPMGSEVEGSLYFRAYTELWQPSFTTEIPFAERQEMIHTIISNQYQSQHSSPVELTAKLKQAPADFEKNLERFLFH